jgi:hypothetical protein
MRQITQARIHYGQDPFIFAVVDLDDSFSQPSIDSRLQVLFDDIFRERKSFVDLANYSGE